MRVSLKWLAEYVDVPKDVKAFCDRLDLTGTGVEGVELLGSAFDGVVIGRIETKSPHPDSDHMWVCSVDVGDCNVDDGGDSEPLQIVCGAQNFEEGDKVVVAMIGATLPGDFKIKKSKLRGIASCGMNCSRRELGMGSDHEGIWILPDDAPVGTFLADYLGLSDTVLDLEITPNRPDCLSLRGMAREVGAMYAQDVSFPERELVESGRPAAESVAVEIVDEERCPRYTARIIEGVEVGPSPDWLVERITAAGARPINNVVDVTNYILFELGQPLHAFDFDKVASSDGKARIIVRSAHDGEKLITLDGETRELAEDMTVISSQEGPLALAGVMGGLESEVDEGTVTVLLETAAFSPAHTSRTSRNLDLISESSIRYERGVDIAAVAANADYAASLLAEVCGGTVRPGLVEAGAAGCAPDGLVFRVGRFQAMMGADIPRDFAIDALRRLGCLVEAIPADDALSVAPPSFRPDLEREIDLYEEVLRLYGMDRIPATLPAGRGRVGVRSEDERKTAVMHAALRSAGLNETMTYSFADPSEISKLGMSIEGLGDPVELINPMNSEQSVMRQSILPGLLRSVTYNQARGVKNIQLYEMGVVFHGHVGKKQPKERKMIAGVLAGAMGEPAWNSVAPAFDFFDAKGVIESLCRELAIPKLRFKPLSANEAPHLQPGRAAEVRSGGSILGWVGEIHPSAVAAFEADAPVAAFELSKEAVLRASLPMRPYVEVPEYPAVQMDIAFVVDDDVSDERLVQCMKSAGGALLESARLFDVYRDEERIGLGRKSMAYALAYRSPDRTLTGEEADKAHERLVKKVCAATGAEVRS